MKILTILELIRPSVGGIRCDPWFDECTNLIVCFKRHLKNEVNGVPFIVFSPENEQACTEIKVKDRWRRKPNGPNILITNQPPSRRISSLESYRTWFWFCLDSIRFCFMGVKSDEYNHIWSRTVGSTLLDENRVQSFEIWSNWFDQFNPIQAKLVFDIFNLGIHISLGWIEFWHLT